MQFLGKCSKVKERQFSIHFKDSLENVDHHHQLAQSYSFKSMRPHLEKTPPPLSPSLLTPSLCLQGLEKLKNWLQTLGIQVKALHAEQNAGQEKKRVFFFQQWTRKEMLRQKKKGIIREICPGQGSSSSQPCASGHVCVWRLPWRGES